MQCLERFPIPIEEIACVQAFASLDAAQHAWTLLAERATTFEDD